MRLCTKAGSRVYSEPRIRNYVSTVPPGPSTFPRRTQCQRENGLVNGKAEAPPVLSFGEVALFRIFAKTTSFRRSENPPSGPVEVALFRIKGKENYRWLRFERFSAERRFDEAPQCVSTAAASSGFARVQDRASTW